MEFLLLPIEDLKVSKFNVRKEYASVNELAASIRSAGLIEPVLVRKKDGEYEVVAGQRRLLACKVAGVRDVPALVKEMSDEEALVSSLTENVQREDVSDLEKAEAVLMLREKGMSNKKIAKQIGVSRKSIIRWIALKNSCEELKNAVQQNKISESDAEEIATSIKDRETQAKVAETVCGLPRNQMRAFVDYVSENKDAVSKSTPEELKNIAGFVSASHLITFTVPPHLRQPLMEASRAMKKSPKEIALTALEEFLRKNGYA